MSEQIQKLRTRTAAPMVACRDALRDAGGDVDKAAELLRIRGVAKAGEIQGRDATQGCLGYYVHHDRSVVAVVELRCQTDFVARLPEFRALADAIAMHVAGRDPAPICVDEADIPAGALTVEQHVQRTRAAESGRPAAVQQRMIDGGLAKWKREICLLSQPFVRDSSKDVRTLLLELSAVVREPVRVAAFVCTKLGGRK